MKANELRIGNWVYSNFTEGNFQISQLIEGVEPTCLPIPLTEDWLQKFGFTGDEGHVIKDITQNKFRPLKVIINLKGEYGIYISVWDEGNEVVLYEGNQFCVHQLQNLIHALTGNELTLTPSAKGE